MTNSDTSEYSYIWVTEDQTALGRIHADGREARIPAVLTNVDYVEFLESGATAAPYVAPPEPPTLTTEEKVTKLLNDYGLSREELKAVIYEEESN